MSPSVFYHGNFCAQCGEPLDRRSHSRLQRHLTPGYLWHHCATSLRPARRLRTLALAFSLLLATLTLSRIAPPLTTSPKPPSALNASPYRAPEYHSLPAPAAFCGATTRRGTPCRRRVRPGERCPQHRLPPTTNQGRPGIRPQ